MTAQFVCLECGMSIDSSTAYHPYAACLMYKACHDAQTVTDNLNAVVAKGAQYDSGFDDMADEIAKLKTALRWYADNMGESKSRDMRIIVQDGGKRAKDALGKK